MEQPCSCWLVLGHHVQIRILTPHPPLRAPGPLTPLGGQRTLRAPWGPCPLAYLQFLESFESFGTLGPCIFILLVPCGPFGLFGTLGGSALWDAWPFCALGTQVQTDRQTNKRKTNKPGDTSNKHTKYTNMNHVTNDTKQGSKQTNKQSR